MLGKRLREERVFTYALGRNVCEPPECPRRNKCVANCLGLLELGTKEPESPDSRRATAEHLRQCKDAP